MTDAVEWNPKHHGHKPHYWKPDMEASLDGKNFVRQEPGQDWAWIAGSTYYVPYEAVHGVRREVVEGGADAGPVDDLLNDYQRGFLEGLDMAAGCVEEFLGGRNPIADAIRLLNKAALQETER